MAIRTVQTFKHALCVYNIPYKRGLDTVRVYSAIRGTTSFSLTYIDAEQVAAAAAALSKVLHKQWVLAGLQMLFVIGTLSWQYVRAKLRVKMSPSTQFGPILAACILQLQWACLYKPPLPQQQAQTKG